MVTMISYGTLKFDMLISRRNPNISFSTQINELEPTDDFNFSSYGHKFAFAAIKNDSGWSAIDPHFVKFMVLLTGH